MYLVELLLSSVMVVSLADIYSVNLRYVTMPLKLDNSVVIEYINRSLEIMLLFRIYDFLPGSLG